MGEKGLCPLREPPGNAGRNLRNVNRNTPGSQRCVVVRGSPHQSLEIQPPRGVANCKGHAGLLGTVSGGRVPESAVVDDATSGPRRHLDFSGTRTFRGQGNVAGRIVGLPVTSRENLGASCAPGKRGQAPESSEMKQGVGVRGLNPNCEALVEGPVSVPMSSRIIWVVDDGCWSLRCERKGQRRLLPVPVFSGRPDTERRIVHS